MQRSSSLLLQTFDAVPTRIARRNRWSQCAPNAPPFTLRNPAPFTSQQAHFHTIPNQRVDHKSKHPSWRQKAHFHPTCTQFQSKRDYYDILGVARDASKTDIKKQYYQLAKRYHPDANKNDPEAAKKFAEATEAWEILGDDEKRQMYDNYGHAGVDEQAGFSEGGGFEDIFGEFASMFGQGRKNGRQAQRGSDIQVNLRISFMEAVRGTTRDLPISVKVTCDTCSGSGAKPGTKKTKCRTCNGSGVEVHQQGFFAVEAPCRRCQGEGSIIESPCTTCRGTGTVKKSKVVQVKIPEGVDNGLNLRLAHQGEAGVRGGPSGHLFVGIQVEPDPFFKRKKNDILVDVPISIGQAILGGTVVVPTLSGEVEMKIPRGVQPNTVMQMRGKGVKELNSSRRGSQLVNLQVHVPSSLTPKQEELLKEFMKEEEQVANSGNSTAKTHTFAATVQETMKRIRDFIKK
uniref:Chaperone protein dnaJ putative n=1 Tax=Albugo laibachii Nc14 TaxID=890382 RepID=F0W1W8_9STRA|nr:chaperone protein dnaJ putative [Albugo laibachii Nc14]|eukprot:CCA15047.1 chaperone protein dnaJ putative [Albugo laibachii Nc14]